MGSVVSAITGSGYENAKDAQVAGYESAYALTQESLDKQLEYMERALDLQEEMFNQAISLGDPYRDAGSVALAQYESLLYGIPIEQTSAYKAVATAPQPSKGTMADDFEDQFYHKYASTGPNSGKQLFYDTKTGKVGFTGDVNLGTTIQTSLTGYDEALAKAKGLVDTALTPGEADLSMFGDATQKASFETSPGYEFRMDEGMKALENSAAARSGVLSGAQIKATQQYAQNTASAEYQNYMNQLLGIVNTGSANAGAGANLTMNSAAQQTGVLNTMATTTGSAYDTMGALKTNIGAAQASGYMNEMAQGDKLINMGAQMYGYFSDPQLKENIVPVGQENGFNIYEFNYLGNPERFIGVMADEVLEINPEAVSYVDGYMTVDYAKIGVEFRRP